MQNLKIYNLGPIADVDITFGDLTLFVGPQATGKSITLEALKLIADRDSIIETLDRYNYIIGHNAKRILNMYFGEGMENIWRDNTKIKLDNETLTLASLAKASSGKESSVFYIPAQRIVCMGDGFPKFFSDFSFTTPYVLREFTETLRAFVQFGLGSRSKVFPINERLKNILRKSFDESIFHSGQVILSEVAGQKKLQLDIDGMNIPFMAWSAGQKEFMPLLLGFYCLSGPASRIVKKEKYKTVIVEEPEMGLHPKAILSVLLQICDLVQSGYKVIVSTHSSIMLEFAWALNTLSGHCDNFHKAVCELFQVSPGSSVGKMLEGFISKSVKTYYFARDNETGKVSTQDISSLDVYSGDIALSEWGGLSAFSTRVNEVVANNIV